MSPDDLFNQLVRETIFGKEEPPKEPRTNSQQKKQMTMLSASSAIVAAAFSTNPGPAVQCLQVSSMAGLVSSSTSNQSGEEPSTGEEEGEEEVEELLDNVDVSGCDYTPCLCTACRIASVATHRRRRVAYLRLLSLSVLLPGDCILRNRVERFQAKGLTGKSRNVKSPAGKRMPQPKGEESVDVAQLGDPKFLEKLAYPVNSLAVTILFIVFSLIFVGLFGWFVLQPLIRDKWNTTTVGIAFIVMLGLGEIPMVVWLRIASFHC